MYVYMYICLGLQPLMLYFCLNISRLVGNIAAQPGSVVYAAQVQTYVHTYIHTYMYMYIHTYIMYMYVRICNFVRSTLLSVRSSFANA